MLDRVDSKETSDGFVESFVNLPNLISISRLISGPVLGWYNSFSKLITDIYIYNFSISGHLVRD